MQQNLAGIKNKEKEEGNNETRVLIINPYPIGANCATGSMMENLFSEYDPTTVLQYYTNNCEIQSNLKFRAEHITLINSFLRKFIKALKTIEKNKHLNKSKPSNKSNLENSTVIRLTNTGVRCSQLMSWKPFVFHIHIKKKLLDTVKSFGPTVIYTQGYSYDMLKYVNLLSEKISCPVVIHTLDDWMETQYKKGLLSAIPFSRFTTLFKKILNNGQIHMVANPDLKNYMIKKYGGNYKFVMNCCEYPKVLEDRTKNISKVLKITYTGGLMLERHETLNQIAKCVNTINSNGKIFELHIYAPDSHTEGYKNIMEESIIFHKNVNHNEVNSILNSSDILIHAESFNPNIAAFTRYSLSTKIPEYLAAGRPLVYLGPFNIGVGKFLKDNKIGIYTNNLVELKEKLLLLYQKDDYYREVAEEGYKKGRIIFDMNNMIQTMNECLLARRMK